MNRGVCYAPQPAPRMHFTLIDAILEHHPDRVVAVKNVTMAEEYLADHFPGFAVLPGVFMLEAMVQTARHLLAATDRGDWVLGEVRALRYGSFVRPGESLRVEVSLDAAAAASNGPGSRLTAPFRGSGTVLRGGTPAETAVSGRFTMRPPNVPTVAPPLGRTTAV